MYVMYLIYTFEDASIDRYSIFNVFYKGQQFNITI